MSTKILYFITGDYAQIPRKFIIENRLFLSCLVFEVKHFFKTPSWGGFKGVGDKRGGPAKISPK